MSLYPAHRASLLLHLPHGERQRYLNTDNDDDNDRDPVLHLLHPRYTCGLTDTDCGNGYCCSAAHECVLPSSSTGETLCRLPGFSTANAVASLASDATGSVTTSGTAATGASATACSGNNDGDCVVVSNGGISGSSSTTSSTGTSGSSSSLSAGAIAGIVVGVVVVLAAVVGAIVFLLCVRRKRRNGRVRNAAVAATPSVTETGRGPPAFQRVPGGGDGGGGGGDGGPVDMYAGSNVGKMQGGVPGRVEVLGDTVQRPMVQELPGNEGVRPVELDAGVEKK